MYVKSDKIKFYPSAYRYYEDGGVSVVTDDEASLNTEYNRTSSIAKVFHSTKGCFVVSDTNDTDLEFFIGGYYVKIENYATNLLADFSSATDIYANLKTALVTPAPSLGNWKDLYEVVEFEHGYKPLDYKVGNDVEFEGISFETSANVNATFSLQLFTRASTSDSFTIVPTSKFILTLSDILGNTGKSAREEIKTNSLLVTTITGANATFSGDISANNIGVTNNLTVGGTVKINNSTISVNGSGDFTFDHSLLFTTSKDIGSSTVPVDDLYVNTINLTTKLVPTNNNVVIGASDNKIKTIYASTVNGDTVNASTINLATSLLPSNSSVNLGASNNKLNTIYLTSAYSNTVYTDALKKYDNSNIELKSSIVPDANDTLSLGTSSYKLKEVYATTFYGNLNGNASTATRATSATTATSAEYATSAGSASSATNATNATNATYAQYTDAQHTSKTIEQRLTELGFRYPSSTQSIALYGGGYLVGYINVLGGSANTSREGNRVILKLSVELNASSGTTGQGVLFSGTSATSTVTIPVEYRPKVNTTFYVPSGQTRYQFTDITSTTYSLRDYCPIKVVVNTDGTFTMSMDNRPTSDFTLMDVGAKTTSITVGYQANPIS